MIELLIQRLRAMNDAEQEYARKLLAAVIAEASGDHAQAWAAARAGNAAEAVLIGVMA